MDTKTDDVDVAVRRALRFLQEHLDDELRLDDLAEVAGYSPFHFHRLFRARVGEPVHGHVKRLRMERAARRLRDTADAVLDVALASGFRSGEGFARAFKAWYGATPSAFRDEHRRDVRLDAPTGVHAPGDGGADGYAPPPPADGPPFRVVTLPPRRVACVRHVGPYDECGPAFERLMAWAGPRGLVGATSEIVGIPWDDPSWTAPERLRYDAALVLGDDADPDVGDGIDLADLAGGPHVATYHAGPYETLGATYDRLFGHGLPSLGRTPREAPCVERYLNDPRTTKPADLFTEVRVPVA